MPSDNNPFAFDPDVDETPAADGASQGNLMAFESPVRLAAAAKYFLALHAVLAVVSIGSSLMQIDLLTEAQSGNPGANFQQRAEANDLRELGVTVVQGLVFLITGVVSLRLLYRLRKNVDHLGATGLANSPGWSIGWFFVPVANLWKPFSATAETWKASVSPQTWTSAETSSALRLWWTFWVLSRVTEQVSAAILRADDNSIPSLIRATWADVVNGAVALVLTVCYAAVLRQITQAQMRTYSRLMEGEDETPVLFSSYADV